MASVPGSCGCLLIGDKAIDFYRSPEEFAERHMRRCKSRVFQARLLNRPTVFIGSNAAVHELLYEKHEDFDMGYREYFYQVYGDNLLFSDGIEAADLKQNLSCFFATLKHRDVIDRYINDAVLQLETRKPTLSIYQHFKGVFFELCLALFLDVHRSTAPDLVTRLKNLCTTHWHGIISVPVNMRVPGILSGYSKSIQAKEELLPVIKEQLKKARGGFAKEMQEMNEEAAVQHLLLFISALVPKALSSVLTSFVLSSCFTEKGQAKKPIFANEQQIECHLLEVLRMWPPFVGGRRIANKDCVIAGMHIPKNHAVLYLAQAAHRDPNTFPEPGQFKPERWLNCTKADKEKLFSFGGGPRSCVGQHLVWDMLRVFTYKLVKTYTWESASNSPFQIKWLPVARPVQTPPLHSTGCLLRGG